MCARNEDALNEVVCCITIVIAINTHTRRGEQEKDCGVIARSRITTRDIFLPWQHHTPPVCIGYGRYTHPSGTIRSTDCAGPRGLQLLSISSAMRCDLDRYTCDVECTPVCPEGLKARTWGARASCRVAEEFCGTTTHVGDFFDPHRHFYSLPRWSMVFNEDYIQKYKIYD